MSRTHSGVVTPRDELTRALRAARIDLAHYEALLVEKHSEVLEDDYLRHLTYIGNTLCDAATRLVSTLEYLSQEGKAQDLPLSMLAFLLALQRGGFWTALTGLESATSRCRLY